MEIDGGGGGGGSATRSNDGVTGRRTSFPSFSEG
jgi:hypothetical protein